MSQIQLINPGTLAPAVGFAHAASHGELVWLGGQIGSDSRGNITHPGDITAQFARALANVETALRAAGCTPYDVLKITYFVTDITSYRANLRSIGRAYREIFDKHYPAASLLGVHELFDPEAMIEIECVAVRSVERSE